MKPADAIAEAMRVLRRAGLEEVAEAIPSLIVSDERNYSERNRLIAEAAEQLFGHLAGDSRRADLMALRLARYFGGADWKHDRLASANPYPAQKERHWWWAVLRAVPSPLSDRQIRRILSRQKVGHR